MGIKLVRGRAFGHEDGEGSAPVTVVSESLAREFWPGQDALGKRIRLTGEDVRWMTVVGVVRDVRPEALSEPPRPTYYVLTPQFARMVGFADQGMTVVLRADGLVMGSGMRLAALGVVIGLAAALASRSVLTALLYEVSPTDPIVLVAVAVTLLGAAAAASWLPARRATTVSPAEVLRGE